MADLAEAGRLEDAAAADVGLAPGDLPAGLGDHRVALEGTGTALTRETDGRPGERSRHTAAPVPRAGDEAGDGPDAVVRLVLVPPSPGDVASS